MATVARRKATKRRDQAGEETQRETQPGEPGGAMTGLELVGEPESHSKLEWEEAKEAGPGTTWIWDRSKQAWVEAVGKSTVEELSGANGGEGREPIEPQQPVVTPAPVTRRGGWRMPAWKRLATRASGVRVIDSRALKSKAPEPSRYDAAVRALTEKGATGIISEVRQEAEGLTGRIIGADEEQARSALSKANEIEEKGKEEALIAKQEAERGPRYGTAGAEELGRVFLKAAEGKAEAVAQNIIARAEERARAQAERIVTEAEGKAEAVTQNIVAKAEERARARAERIVAEAEETCQQRVSQAEQQAQLILKTAQDKTEGIRTAAETTAKAVPAQLSPRREEGDQEEMPVLYEGTAELVLRPPVDLRRMQKVLNRLAKSHQIKVLDLGGSAGKGIGIKLFSRNLARLPNILEALPEIEKVSDLPRKVSKICHGQQMCPGLWKGSEPPARRLLVTMENGPAYLEI